MLSFRKARSEGKTHNSEVLSVYQSFRQHSEAFPGLRKVLKWVVATKLYHGPMYSKVYTVALLSLDSSKLLKPHSRGAKLKGMFR